MKRLWTHRDMNAPAEVLWELLTNPSDWPAWGPSVRDARIDGDVMAQGATGTVTTALGVDLRFEITAYDPGVSWAWTVAGIAATDHRIEPLGADRCRVGFGVPWPVAPYLAVCRLALARLHAMADDRGTTS